MRLLTTLCSGMRGAENGEARIYARGSVTEVQYYQDFEGQVPVAAGTAVVLNSRGQAVVYVDQVVTVQCWDEDGAELSPFTEGDSAAAVEVVSEAALGADYETGEAGALKPLTLLSALNLWLEQAGAPLWKVLVGGEEKTLLEVLGSFLAVVFNVKDVTYGGGAVGDGIEDDTAAVAAAISACEDAGGGWVYFPPGHYRLTADLSVSGTVMLTGSTAQLSRLILVGAQVILTGPNTTIQYVKDLGFQYANAEGDPLLTFGDSVAAEIVRCRFNPNLNATEADGLVGRTDATGFDEALLRFRDCEFFLTDGGTVVTQIGVNTIALGADCDLTVEDSRFYYTDTIASGYAIYAQNPRVRGCRFELAAITTVTGTAGGVYGANGGMVTDNNFIEPATSLSGNYYCMRIPTAGGDDLLREAANRFGDGNFPNQFMPFLVTGTSSSGSLDSRGERFLEVSGDDDSAFTADLLNYGTVYHKRTATGDQTISITMGPEGSRGRLTIDNTAGGGTIVFKWGSNITGLHAWEQLLTGEVRSFEFEFYLDGSTVKARQIGTSDGIVGELRLEQSGLSAATVNQDFDITSVWDALPSGKRLRIKVLSSLADGADGRQREQLGVIVTSGTTLSSVVTNGAYGDVGIALSISSAKLRVAGTAGSGNVSAMQTSVKVLKAMP